MKKFVCLAFVALFISGCQSHPTLTRAELDYYSFKKEKEIADVMFHAARPQLDEEQRKEFEAILKIDFKENPSYKILIEECTKTFKAELVKNPDDKGFKKLTALKEVHPRVLKVRNLVPGPESRKTFEAMKPDIDLWMSRLEIQWDLK